MAWPVFWEVFTEFQNKKVYTVSLKGDSNFALLRYRKIKHTGIHPSTFWYIWYAVDHCLPRLTTFINNCKGLYLGAFGSQRSVMIFLSICPFVCNKEAKNLWMNLEEFYKKSSASNLVKIVQITALSEDLLYNSARTPYIYRPPYCSSPKNNSTAPILHCVYTALKWHLFYYLNVVLCCSTEFEVWIFTDIKTQCKIFPYYSNSTTTESSGLQICR
jgi:hypothetical protein